MAPDYEVVRVIIENGSGEILLLRRSQGSFEGGRWCLPGGKRELSDSLEETASIEVHQESRYRVDELNYLFQIDISHYYHTAKFEGEFDLNEESDNFAWVPPRQIGDYDIAFRNDVAIERWLQER